MADDFTTALLKLISAQLYVSLQLQIANDLFGCGFCSLSQTERLAVERAMHEQIGPQFRQISPEWLGAGAQSAFEAGFRGPAPTTQG